MSSRYFQLQFLVLILAFTAILGRLITLPAPLLVLWRTALAAIIMFIWLAASRRAPLTMPRKKMLSACGVGIILGLHWMTFFGSIQLANISVCLAGMASTSLFTALSEPLLDRRKPCWKEILLGLMIVPGLAMVAGASWDHAAGLGCALVSAFLASLFPVLNRKLTLAGQAPQTITLYELISACGTCLIAVLCIGDLRISQMPSSSDWLWLLILSGVCTVWAFSFHIHLLRYFTAFTTNLAVNFEPVYGILLAALLFQEYHELNPMFYFGALCIIAANILHVFIGKKTPESGAGELPLNK
ncbi:DMT family transporter [Verrucomicrobiaceae bacterium N1E253]|uniref:DMT family transporter n=1 Tax=Oceaniferula marina TaxID=2748318 RepID=A0A851GH78_9BACT|nr:DMT family transporter [Oceaniferula marina]NWK56883.1 DMT family transporter [Oceaniferula marina]